MPASWHSAPDPIDVSEARDERRPLPVSRDPLDEGGRGLLLVEALSSRGEVLDRVPVGKTVRAEIDLVPTLSGPPRAA